MSCRTCGRIALTCLFTLSILIILSTSLPATAQSATFSRVPNNGIPGGVFADVNNDGIEDMISGAANGISVRIGYGDGTYSDPLTYTGADTSTWFTVVGDFNGDGWLDVIATAGTPKLYEWLNNGDGTFRFQAAFVATDNLAGIVTADFNHDGKPDIAFNSGYGTPTVTPMLNVWYGNGDGTFSPISRTPLNSDYYRLYLGDFDGDGNPDLMAENHSIGTSIEILYSLGPNSNGQFVTKTDQTVKNLVEPFDVDGDGITDIIDSYDFYTTHSTGWGQEVDIYYGHTDRTFTTQVVPLSRCSSWGVAVADFNGDGLPDIAVREHATCDGSAPGEYISILRRNVDGSYQPEQDVYSTSGGVFTPYVIRANGDNKPDLSVEESFNNGTSTTYSFSILLNTSAGNFPSCAPPSSAIGIHICSPGTTTPSGTVHFGIGAAGQTPMRKVEVWVDGNKAKEQLAHAFSHYGFLDADLNLSDGNHTVEVYAAGWDNLLQHTGFTLTVGSGGGTGSCAQPFGPGVNICSPAQESTVTSPFTISASGKNANGTAGLDVWLDGQKVGFYSGTSVNVQVTATAGSHQLDVYAVGADGTLEKATVLFTVSGSSGGGCAIPSTPGVLICSPVNGSTVNSPLTISAAGRNSGSTAGLDVWLDGFKVGWYPGQTVNVQVYTSPGGHQLDVYAVGTNGELQRAMSIFTVAGQTSCPTPSSPGVNICAPVQGSTVSSPVTVQATGRNTGATAGMDVWLDGNKIGWYTGTSIDIQITNVGPGPHQIDIYAVGTNNELQLKSVTFNVQ